MRGRGLLWALEIENASEIVARCMEQGLLVNAPQPNVLRLMPALNVTKSEVAEMARILSAVVDATISPTS